MGEWGSGGQNCDHGYSEVNVTKRSPDLLRGEGSTK